MSCCKPSLRGIEQRAQVKCANYCGDFGLNILFRSARVDGATLRGFCGEGAFVIHPRRGKRLVLLSEREDTMLIFFPVTEQGVTHQSL